MGCNLAFCGNFPKITDKKETILQLFCTFILSFVRVPRYTIADSDDNRRLK